LIYTQSRDRAENPPESDDDKLLTISRKELAKALALVTIGVRKGKPSEVRFSVADGFLDIMGAWCGSLGTIRGNVAFGVFGGRERPEKNRFPTSIG
jgi:hypothetical protein